MQRVLITGAAGMLGSVIARHLIKNNDFEVFGTGRSEFQPSYTYIKADLTKEDELNNLLAVVEPDIIINCAAIVSLNTCEQNKNEAHELHVETTKKLASYNSGKCKFIYISTDSVFDGKYGNYTETDTTRPLNYYALSKLEGETAALFENHSSLIIRTNIYGFNENRNGNSLFEWIYKSLNNNQSISGFTDVYFNPLYTGQLAEVIELLVNRDIKGVINAGCNEKISKFHFALLIAEIFAFDESLIKQDVSDTMPSILQRPKNTTLNTEKLYNIIQSNYSIADGIHQLKIDYKQQKSLHD